MVPNRANCFIFAFSEPENFTKNKNTVTRHWHYTRGSLEKQGIKYI